MYHCILIIYSGKNIISCLISYKKRRLCADIKTNKSFHGQIKIMLTNNVHLKKKHYLDNSINGTGLLTEPTENTLSHVNVVACCTATAICSLFCLNRYCLCWTDCFTEFTSNTTFLVREFQSVKTYLIYQPLAIFAAL